MAEMHFFSTWDDSVNILKELMARGDFRAIPKEGPYRSPQFRTFDRFTPVLDRHVREHGGVWILGSFSTHPLYFDRFDSGPAKGSYYLPPVNAGPYLSFSGSGVSDVDGLPTLLLGDLSYERQYALEPDAPWVKPTQALKDTYAELVKLLKKHLLRYKQSLWIGPEALRLYEAGQATINALGVLQDLAKYDAAHAPVPKTKAPARGKIDRRRDLAAKVASE